MKNGTFVTKKELDNLVRVKFEDAEVYVPQSWDSYLKRQYGNYMKLPPPEKRTSAHDVIADPFTPCSHTEILYWKDRRSLENQCS
jgi:lipopolysaccharide cholinephosphotransferase